MSQLVEIMLPGLLTYKLNMNQYRDTPELPTPIIPYKRLRFSVCANALHTSPTRIPLHGKESKSVEFAICVRLNDKMTVLP